MAITRTTVVAFLLALLCVLSAVHLYPSSTASRLSRQDAAIVKSAARCEKRYKTVGCATSPQAPAMHAKCLRWLACLETGRKLAGEKTLAESSDKPHSILMFCKSEMMRWSSGLTSMLKGALGWLHEYYPALIMTVAKPIIGILAAYAIFSMWTGQTITLARLKEYCQGLLMTPMARLIIGVLAAYVIFWLWTGQTITFELRQH